MRGNEGERRQRRGERENAKKGRGGKEEEGLHDETRVEEDQSL